MLDCLNNTNDLFLRKWSMESGLKVKSYSASPTTLPPNVNTNLHRTFTRFSWAHTFQRLVSLFVWPAYLFLKANNLGRLFLSFCQDSDSLISIITAFVYVNLKFVLYIILFQPLLSNVEYLILYSFYIYIYKTHYLHLLLKWDRPW